jgi:cation transporter-like permease
MLNVVEAVLIGILAHLVTVLLGSQRSSLVILLGISVFASIVSSGIIIPITLFSAIFFYRRNIDPDTVMSPYLATFGDIVSLFALYIATRVIIGGG